MKKIVVLAPHPDDVEFGCGASIHKFSKAGATISYIAFSPCRESIPSEFEKDILYKELLVAAPKIGIPQKQIHTYEFPVRHFQEHRQEILEILVKIKNEYQPDLVLLPNSDDYHQDHQVIHMEGRRAFKKASILGYELPWNSKQFHSTYFELISEENLKAKVDAIRSYKSQGFRSYSDSDFFKGLARVRGEQSGAQYAEAFEVIKWISNEI